MTARLTSEAFDFEAFNYRTIIQTRFTDLNSGNHVSNIAIIQMFEDARTRFYNTLGIEVVGKDHVLMIVSNHINYMSECHWPTDFEVFCKVSKIGKSSFEILQLGRQKQANIAALRVTSVFTKNGKSAPLNSDFISALSK